VIENDRAARQLGGAIRSYLAAIGGEQTLDDRREGAKVQEILAAVINFEHVGDIIANSLTDFSVKQLRRGQLLAPEEIAAVSAMNVELVESHRLAVSVFLRGNRSDALLLLERKRRLLQLEGEATALSVRMLREAAAAGRAAGTDPVGSAAEESGLLLRIVRDLRRVHSHLASFAYPVVRRAQRRTGARVDDDGAAAP
jgi:phosphate:Na+ symporter